MTDKFNAGDKVRNHFRERVVSSSAQNKVFYRGGGWDYAFNVRLVESARQPKVGDKVRLTPKEPFEGEIRYMSAPYANVTIPDGANLTSVNLDEWDVEFLEPELPTVPGMYSDATGRYVELRDTGEWSSRGMRLIVDDVQRRLPLTRLVPEKSNG